MIHVINTKPEMTYLLNMSTIGRFKVNFKQNETSLNSQLSFLFQHNLRF